MKLNELKQEVYDCWIRLSTYRGALVQPENFKPEVRIYGDLRRKSTWLHAYAVFFAKINWEAGITEHTAIVHVLNFTPDRWDYELRDEIIEQFLAIPGAIEFISRGLEAIFHSADKEEREAAHGLLEVVGRQSGRTRGIATGHLRQLQGFTAS
jgi:hypothetical protein